MCTATVGEVEEGNKVGHGTGDKGFPPMYKRAFCGVYYPVPWFSFAAYRVYVLLCSGLQHLALGSKLQ